MICTAGSGIQCFTRNHQLYSQLRLLLIKGKNSCLSFCGFNYHPPVEGIDLGGIKLLSLTLTRALLQCQNPVYQYKTKFMALWDYTMALVAIYMLFKQLHFLKDFRHMQPENVNCMDLNQHTNKKNFLLFLIPLFLNYSRESSSSGVSGVLEGCSSHHFPAPEGKNCSVFSSP